jgi:putative ABC transport system permease protein
MITHYLKVAIRNIFKDKIYSLINLIGLSIAIACCFLLIFWIRFELSFEDCQPKAGRIYKVLEVEERAAELHKSDWIRPGIASQLKETFPEIEASTIIHHESLPFIYEDNEGIMVDYTSATPDYLDMFTYKYIEGSKENVLQNRGVIMSEETAKKFFGKESAIGKTVTFGSTTLRCNVQAVVKVPQNTHIRFDILNPFGQINYGVHYILIKENTHFSEETQLRMANFLSTIRETEHRLSFQPLKDIHLHSPKELVVNSSGDLKQIYLFSLVALLILIIAIINYVNTSTARAMSRMKEVGVRKVTGSTQRQLILRFLTDAFIISLASIVIALILSKYLFPEFSMMMGNKVAFSLNFSTIAIALTVCIFITILSGGYAAFYLSSFNPVTILRGEIHPGSKENLRKFLTGFQFFLSVGMLISTLFIYKQIHYMFTAETGIDRKNIIILDTNLWYQAEDFIQIIKRENSNIIDATIAWGAPYNAQYSASDVSWEGCPDAVKEMEFGQIFCDYHYANVFGLKVINGEFIQPGWTWWQDADKKSYNIVINEAFQKLMGVNNPIGITINYGAHGKIIGVVKDFNFKPLKEPITPLIICFNPEASNKVYIKTTGKNKKETLDYILKKYREMSGQIKDNKMPVMYHTVEDDFNSMYKSELQTLKMLTVFSIISLCLSVMGIFGMITFMIEKRTKEIAIRRINGAETKDIFFLFISNFAKIIGIACAIAIPVSFIILYRWIQSYAFRTSLSWWIFILVPLVVSIITAVIIAVQVLFATRRNPAEVIKLE